MKLVMKGMNERFKLTEPFCTPTFWQQILAI